MLLETRAVEPFFKNGFVLACEESRDGVIIDPGDEVALLLDIVFREQLTIRYILLTHAHVDHITGVKRAKEAVAAPVGLHPDDHFPYEGAVQQGLLFGLRVEAPPPVDFFYAAGAVYRFGRYEARVHHTPGHCPGGVCLQVGLEGAAGPTTLRRRYALCGIHWPDRSARRRLRDAHTIHSRGPVRVRR